MTGPDAQGHDTTRHTSAADYTQRLILALRLHEVPGDRIGEIVAEVQSHVADTGEDPVDAFGSPRAYAASLVDEHRPSAWWTTALTVAASGLAGWLLAQGMFNVALGTRTWGQPGWVWIGLALVIGIPGGFAVWRRSTRVRDPRTGEDLAPFTAGGLLALIGTPVVLVLAAVVAIRISS